MTAAHSPLDRLDKAVIAAHAAADGAGLARLYGEAAETFATCGDIESACFFFTQAYIYALECGAPQARRYAAFLKENGRL